MPTTSATTPLLEELRTRIARLEQSGGPILEAQTIPFGLAALDGRLPGKGLQTGALHEVAGAGPDTEHGAAATLMVAGILARIPGQVLWVVTQRDLFTPALAAVGLHPDRVIIAEAGKDVLLVMEEGLRHRGLAGVVSEVGTRLTLTWLPPATTRETHQTTNLGVGSSSPSGRANPEQNWAPLL
jgi:protein ImuA